MSEIYEVRGVKCRIEQSPHYHRHTNRFYITSQINADPWNYETRYLLRNDGQWVRGWSDRTAYATYEDALAVIEVAYRKSNRWLVHCPRELAWIDFEEGLGDKPKRRQKFATASQLPSMVSP